MKNKISSHNVKELFLLTVIFLMSVLLSACGSGGLGNAAKGQLDVGSGALNIEFPTSLNKYLKDDTELTATIKVDAGLPKEMSVDRKNKKLVGTIDNLSKGPHILVIEYTIKENGKDISIAIGTINITVGDREILNITYNDFVYTDNDKDGITNIAELEFGTDIDDATSKPEAHGLRASENFAIRDNAINSSLVVGATSSENYKIQ